MGKTLQIPEQPRWREVTVSATSRTTGETTSQTFNVPASLVDCVALYGEHEAYARIMRHDAITLQARIRPKVERNGTPRRTRPLSVLEQIERQREREV